ncbi:MAG: mechanosensitive ion channel family protein [Candidatus ainarchaeum sp.]|nr:mechanosensitive ion channel family protein [Candidatus ainarchaeum sp.]
MLSITLPYTEGLRALPGGDITAFFILLFILSTAFNLLLAIVLRIAGEVAGRTKTTIDDRILKVMAGYLPPISILTALWLAVEAVYPGALILGSYNDFDVYVTLLLIILGFLLSSLADAVLLWYGIEIRARAGRKSRDEEVFPFVRNIVRITILAVFAVFILNRMGFETAAIITGLGIGGLAVALALQDTLGNFFAGVHILVDKPFREENYVKLDNGMEGTIKKIGWRTTRMVTLAQNEVIVPNSKLASAVVENYSTPSDLSGVLYQVGVDYKEDIDDVEKVITEALRRSAKKTQMVDEQTIWVRFDSFGDYALNFKFGYLVKGAYVNRFNVLKDVNRELFYSFKKEGIGIPFPVRVIYQKEGKK